MAEYRVDQADGLRRLFGRRQTRVLAFVPGGVGVGASTLIANLATQFALLGRKVLIIDENTQSAVGDFLGLRSGPDFLKVINGELPLADSLVNLNQGMMFLSVAQAVKALPRLASRQSERWVANMRALEGKADIILVDSTADYPLGLSPFGLAAQDTVIVASTRSSSITNTYALIKKVSLAYAKRHFHIMINKAYHAEEARAIFGNIARLSYGKGLAHLNFAGFVPFDASLLKIKNKGGFSALLASAPAVQACHRIAHEILAWRETEENDANLEQFARHLIHLSQHIDPVPIYA